MRARSGAGITVFDNCWDLQEGMSVSAGPALLDGHRHKYS